jgi:hypothetical protein
MSRNESRTNTQSPIPEQPLTYSPPTTHVPLPSRGKLYSHEHPLHGKDTIEIKQMTTREEEILTNVSLLQKGLVVDKLIQSVVVDSSVNPETLLVGDKNAILIASRIDGYGKEYEITVACPACGKQDEKEVDLSQLAHKEIDESINMTERGTFTVALPRTGYSVELKLLNGKDEKMISETNEKTKKYGLERPIATQYSRMVVSVNGNQDPSMISSFVSEMPVQDSRAIRKAYKKANPDVDLTFDFQCDHCGHDQGLEVPITANFFWTD